MMMKKIDFFEIMYLPKLKRNKKKVPDKFLGYKNCKRQTKKITERKLTSKKMKNGRIIGTF
jgi:hypothetical protein